jgi:pyruvate dehydrogenase E2 component (dihydrolipoamide acetyltransferase)
MTRAPKISGWRKLAAAMWSAPNDPQFYGDLEIDAASALAYVDELRRTTGEHVTLTHLTVKAVAAGLAAVPSLNMRLAHGREYPRESIDVFLIVAIGREELTGIKIREADKKTVVEIARDVERQTTAIRKGEDAQLGRTKAMLELLPPRVLRTAMRVSAWLTSDRDLDLPKMGLPREAFGSALVSAIGSTGISHAYSPLAPYYRVPLLVLLGAVKEQAVVVSGRVVARPILTLTATFDHRYTDGLAATDFGNAAAAYLRNPAAADRALTVTVPAQRNRRTPTSPGTDDTRATETV